MNYGQGEFYPLIRIIISNIMILGVAVTPLEIFEMELFQGGDCFCLGHLLSDESMTNSAYAEKTIEIIFCAVSILWYIRTCISDAVVSQRPNTFGLE